MSAPTFFVAVPLLAILAVATFCDLRERRIPNALSLGGAALGLLVNVVTLGPAGAVLALIGWALCLGCLVPLYVSGGTAAGDVKLMAMVGAFIGPQDMPLALLATLLAGGVLTLTVTLCEGTTRQMLHNVRNMLCSAWWRLACREVPRIDPVPDSAGRMPYAFAIASGAWLQWMRADSSLAARLALY